MSYTMTIDAPRSVLTLATDNGKRSAEDLGRVFVAFLQSRYLASSRGKKICDPVGKVIGCISTKKSSDQLVKEIRGA